MKLLLKTLLIAGVFAYTGNINSFDDMQDALQHMHQLFEEDSALLELYNAGNAPTLSDHVLSDNEVEQFWLSREPWDTPLFDDLLEQNISDLSTLAPSTSSEYIVPPYDDISLPQHTEEGDFPEFVHETLLESTPLALQTAASSVLRVQKRKSRKKKFSCDYPGCTFATAYENSLARHKLTHTGEKPYKCNYPGCTYAAAHDLSLTAHQYVHTGEEPYKCDYPGCDFATKYKCSLNTHTLIHTREKSLPQYTKEEAFPEFVQEALLESTPLALQTATSSVLRAQRNSRKEKFSCDYPGCTFATAYENSLARHKCTHTEETLYKCDYPECPFTNTRKDSLARHKLSIHTGEKPYKCDHPGCAYASTRKDDLIKHTRIHTGEKPYKCDYTGCTYTTGDNSHLKRHKDSQHLRIPDQESSENKRQRRQ